MLHVTQITEKMTGKPASGNFQHPYKLFENQKQKKSLKGKCKEQPRIAADGTEHADDKTLHRKLISKPVEFQRSPKKYKSPKKPKIRGPGVKYVSASERARLVEEGILSGSKSKVRKIELDEKGSDFECCDKSNGTPVHVNIDKELAVDKPTLVLLPNRSEEDKFNNSSVTEDWDGNVRLRRSNRIIKPMGRLGSVSYF